MLCTTVRERFITEKGALPIGGTPCDVHSTVTRLSRRGEKSVKTPLGARHTTTKDQASRSLNASFSPLVVSFDHSYYLLSDLAVDRYDRLNGVGDFNLLGLADSGPRWRCSSACSSDTYAYLYTFFLLGELGSFKFVM